MQSPVFVNTVGPQKRESGGDRNMGRGGKRANFCRHHLKIDKKTDKPLPSALNRQNPTTGLAFRLYDTCSARLLQVPARLIQVSDTKLPARLIQLVCYKFDKLLDFSARIKSFRVVFPSDLSMPNPTSGCPTNRCPTIRVIDRLSNYPAPLDSIIRLIL